MSETNNSVVEQAAAAGQLKLKYPSTMSCIECLDQLIDCLSVGGQIRNYYRYSEFNICETQMNKLKFCLSNGKDPVKIQEYYKSLQEYNKKHRGTSEDIWEERWWSEA